MNKGREGDISDFKLSVQKKKKLLDDIIQALGLERSGKVKETQH